MDGGRVNPFDSGVFMVITPKSLAAQILHKAVRMAQMGNTPVIGVVENMAGFFAPDTEKRYDIFGPSHAWEVATLAGTQVLARLPIDPDIAAQCDAGRVEDVVRLELEVLVDKLARLVPVSRPANKVER
jgi:Mrp family chromosome partitioning ATPase